MLLNYWCYLAAAWDSSYSVAANFIPTTTQPLVVAQTNKRPTQALAARATCWIELECQILVVGLLYRSAEPLHNRNQQAQLQIRINMTTVMKIATTMAYQLQWQLQ